MYKCKYCGILFERSTDVANHVKSVHKPVVYGTRICECCGKEVTAQGGSYKTHLISCRKRNVPYTCQSCGKMVSEWFGSGKFCSQKCAHTRKQKPESIKLIRKRSIEYLGFDFYINKLNRVLIAVINKKSKPKKERIRYTGSTAKLCRHHTRLCKGCGIRYTEAEFCKECKRYKLYIDFKEGKIKISFISAKHLLEKYEGHKCSICGISEWNGKPLPMICDHIDGHANNNTYANLRLVCSNCDSQLPTYKSKNKKSDRKKRGHYC